MQTLTKTRLTTSLSDTRLSSKELTQLLNKVFETMQAELQKGNKVLLPGIGTLTPIRKPPKTVKGFNKEFAVGERVKVKFTVSDKLEVQLNSNNDWGALTKELKK